MNDETAPARSFIEREGTVVEKMGQHIPQVRWMANYVVLGAWDYVDIFEAPDTETALKTSALIRQWGNACTEVWPVMPWLDFKESAADSFKKMSTIPESA